MKTDNSAIRKKPIDALVGSVGAASLCMLLPCVMIIMASAHKPFAVFFTRHVLVFEILFLTIFLALTTVFFLLFIRRSATYTIRKKLIYALTGSVGTAGLCMLLLCVLMILASAYKPFAIFFNRYAFGFVILFLAIFSVLTVAFFLLFIRGGMKYLDEITKTLGTVSGGNLDVDIPVRSGDELGEMARTVNEMALRLKTSLEEERRSEKAKNDLITNISHDLRTPVTSVLGYLELAVNGKPRDYDSLQKYAGIAYGKSKELKELIDDLFEYSKLNDADMVASKIRISIGELLEQVILGFIPALGEAGMEYRLSFADRKIYVDADPALLTRLFGNLVNNAVQYGREGKYLDIGLDRENEEAVVRLANYGITIPAAELPHIFEKFYRVEKTGSGKTGGSGLGLAIVKRIAEIHGGSVSVCSRENKTVFEVRLKTADTDAKQR